MGLRIALALFISASAPALNLFSKPTRLMDMRSAVVEDVSFVVIHGKLYRQSPGASLVNISRWPRISKIAKFGRTLVALTYQGDLQVWRRGAEGQWHSTAMTTPEFTDFSANAGTLVAIDRTGHAYAAHPGELDAPVAFEPVLAEVENLSSVAGYAPDRGFALIKTDSTRVLLDATGVRCERLLGLR